MGFTTCSVATNNIASLDDLPNDTGGLTAAQLKAAFDKFGVDFVAWLNATHIPEINACPTVPGGTGQKIQYGQTTITIATAGTAVSKAITFGTAYSTAPVIFLTLLTGISTAGYVNIVDSSATASGFTLVANSYTAQTIGVNWMAIGS